MRPLVHRVRLVRKAQRELLVAHPGQKVRKGQRVEMASRVLMVPLDLVALLELTQPFPVLLALLEPKVSVARLVPIRRFPAPKGHKALRVVMVSVAPLDLVVPPEPRAIKATPVRHRPCLVPLVPLVPLVLVVQPAHKVSEAATAATAATVPKARRVHKEPKAQPVPLARMVLVVPPVPPAKTRPSLAPRVHKAPLVPVVRRATLVPVARLAHKAQLEPIQLCPDPVVPKARKAHRGRGASLVPLDHEAQPARKAQLVQPGRSPCRLSPAQQRSLGTLPRARLPTSRWLPTPP